jgi:hypothetical protein
MEQTSGNKNQTKALLRALIEWRVSWRCSVARVSSRKPSNSPSRVIAFGAWHMISETKPQQSEAAYGTLIPRGKDL